MVKAIYPGSFDPLTLGHCDIIHKASCIFDQVIVGVATNSKKQGLFSFSEKKDMILDFFPSSMSSGKIIVVPVEGFVADYARQHDIKHIVRGIRNMTDALYEMDMADTNKMLGGIETVFLMSNQQYRHTSSSLVKEMIVYESLHLNNHVSPFVGVKLKEKMNVIS